MEVFERKITSPGEARISAPKPIPKDVTEKLPEDPAEKPGVPEPIRIPEPVKSKIEARLNYDPFESDVFVEILDTQSGEVLRRFPAEKAAEDEVTKRGGAILNWRA
ncbi:MAG: hypothetical protein ABJ215_04390 [Alphaproteobacteria bacterium]